jgi:hypothetical protein
MSAPQTTCRRYSFATNEWSEIASLPLARPSGHALIHKDRILIIGRTATGTTSSIYDPATNTWASLRMTTAPTATDKYDGPVFSHPTGLVLTRDTAPGQATSATAMIQSNDGWSTLLDEKSTSSWTSLTEWRVPSWIHTDEEHDSSKPFTISSNGIDSHTGQTWLVFPAAWATGAKLQTQLKSPPRIGVCSTTSLHDTKSWRYFPAVPGSDAYDRYPQLLTL